MSDFASQLQWIEPGFEWLDENWPEESESTWHDVRAGFLSSLHASDDHLGLPGYGVLAQVVYALDTMTSDTERRHWVEPSARQGLVEQAYTTWSQSEEAQAEAAATEGAHPDAAPGGGAHDDAAAPEVQYFEGHGWMSVDPVTNSWVPAEAPPGADTPAGPAGGETPAGPAGGEPAVGEAGAPADGEAAPAPGAAPEPAEVAARAAEEIAIPALAAAIQSVPELAGLPADELASLVSEVLAERLAAAGVAS